MNSRLLTALFGVCLASTQTVAATGGGSIPDTSLIRQAREELESDARPATNQPETDRLASVSATAASVIPVLRSLWEVGVSVRPFHPAGKGRLADGSTFPLSTGLTLPMYGLSVQWSAPTTASSPRVGLRFESGMAVHRLNIGRSPGISIDNVRVYSFIGGIGPRVEWPTRLLGGMDFGLDLQAGGFLQGQASEIAFANRTDDAWMLGAGASMKWRAAFPFFVESSYGYRKLVGARSIELQPHHIQVGFGLAL